MQIIAKRPFISQKSEIGNVPEGRILDLSDDYAKSLILAGLADEYIPNPANSATKKTSFFLPKKETVSGSLSQADQASPRETVKKSKRGARNPKTDT